MKEQVDAPYWDSVGQQKKFDNLNFVLEYPDLLKSTSAICDVLGDDDIRTDDSLADVDEPKPGLDYFLFSSDGMIRAKNNCGHSWNNFHAVSAAETDCALCSDKVGRSGYGWAITRQDIGGK